MSIFWAREGLMITADSGADDNVCPKHLGGRNGAGGEIEHYGERERERERCHGGISFLRACSEDAVRPQEGNNMVPVGVSGEDEDEEEAENEQETAGVKGWGCQKKMNS
eukprot:12405987-Karenia_brevis.AAC.1